MELNNEKMVLLSKFATKAKKHIGMVELHKMFNSQQYANNIIIKARLSEDKELAILTKILNQELNLNAIEINSIESYLSAIKAEDANLDYIESSKYFLIILADYLFGIPADGKAYRQAVERMIRHANIAEQPLCLQIARSYYPFWLNEHKLACNTHNQALSKANLSENESLKKDASALWGNIDAEFFSTVEVEPINLYIASLHKKDIPSEQIQTKQKFAKIIMKELRREDGGMHSYRKVIEKTQHLFTRQDVRHFFLMMSRDFYYFWTASQQAE